MIGQRNLRLDGLRGVAALVVLVSHSANAGFLPLALGQGFGQTGVALFFALSGYLMGHLYLGRPYDLKSEVAPYLVRRGARVLPMFYFVVGIVGFFWLAGFSTYGVTRSTQWLWNVLLIRGTSVLWSVPVEIHFYGLFLVIWYCASRGQFWLGVFILLLTQAVLSPIVTKFVASPTWIVHWIWVFVSGVILARAEPWVRRQPAMVWTVFAIGILLFAPLVPPAIRDHLGFYKGAKTEDLVAILYPIALLVATVAAASPLGWLAWRPFLFLGKVSYSVYLTHLGVIHVVGTIIMPDGRAWVLGFPIILLLTVILATVTHRFVEQAAEHALRARLLAKGR